MTHNLTHTGEGAEKFSGDKTARDLIFPSQKCRKPQETSQEMPWDHLVRMRSLVRIWIAAPKTPDSIRNQAFFQEKVEANFFDPHFVLHEEMSEGALKASRQEVRLFARMDIADK